MKESLLQAYFRQAYEKAEKEKVSLSDFAEKIRKEILDAAAKPAVPSGAELNKFASTLYAEEKKKGKMPVFHYLHRISQAEMEERAGYHTRAATVVANQTATECLLGKGKEQSTAAQWTSLFAEGKTEKEFLALPESERTAAFMRWLSAQEKMLSESFERISEDRLLTFAEENAASLSFGKQMTAEKVAMLAEQLQVPLADSTIENYEENYEPFLPALAAVQKKVYGMANPYYLEYDLAEVEKMAARLPAEKWPQFEKSFTGFFAIAEQVKEENELAAPFSGTVSACFDNWMRRLPQGKNRIFGFTQPEKPIADLDICTELLLNGEPLLVAESAGKTHLIYADPSTGQIGEKKGELFADLENGERLMGFVAETGVELSLCGGTADCESYKNFERSLRTLLKADATEKESYFALAAKTAQAAKEYAEEKKCTEKPFGEKVRRRVALAQKVCEQLSCAVGIFALRKHNEMVTGENIEENYYRLNAKHEARQVPGFFSGEYGKTYRAEQEVLNKMKEKLPTEGQKESQISAPEEQTSEPAQERSQEDEELAQKLFAYLQSEKGVGSETKESTLQPVNEIEAEERKA